MAYNTEEKKIAYRRKYRPLNKTKINSYTRNWYLKKRLELIESFGGKCKECGISDPILLDFDHINNDGYLDRLPYKKRIEFRVSKEPHRFQLLCKNCNWKKEYLKRKAQC